MTFRQGVLKRIYPLFMAVQGRFGRKKILVNTKQLVPTAPFYELELVLNDGTIMPMSYWKGKKVLIANTASDCGFTAQYAQLQQLYERFAAQLVIIAFPSNDFGQQEKGTDKDIALFCGRNYAITFPVAQKSTVVKQAGQHPVFQWLTDSKLNGWNDQSPSWNFSKYLINEEGMLTHYFDPGISPLSKTVMNQLIK